MKKTILIAVPFALLLGACSGPAPSDQADGSAPAPTAAPATAQVEAPATTLIHAEPAVLPDCNPAVVTLRWNVFTTHPEIKTVKVYSGDRVFVHSAATGKQATGPWVRPGAVFTLKNGADDTELEKITIGGPACSP
jgi:hypothetical protein